MSLNSSVPFSSEVKMGEHRTSGPFSAQQWAVISLALSSFNEYLFQCFLSKIGCDSCFRGARALCHTTVALCLCSEISLSFCITGNATPVVLVLWTKLEVVWVH